MPVYTIKQDGLFGDLLPFTIYREDAPILAVAEGARANQVRDTLAASEPTTGPHHGGSISEQVRLATALVGTDDLRGRQELRDIIAHLGAVAVGLERIRAAGKATQNVPCGALTGGTYNGPSPPPPQVHDYEWTVTALDAGGQAVAVGRAMRKFPE